MKLLATLVSLAFIVLVVLFDAARLKKEHPAIYQTRMGSGPGAWGVLVFLFSIIALPIYLLSRDKYFADYQRLPPEQKQVPGTNSFLKTCLSAKIIITWSLIVQAASLVTALAARGLGIPLSSLTQTMDVKLLLTFFLLCVFFILAWFAAREYPQLGFREIFDLKYKKTGKFKFFVAPLLISLFMALVTVCLLGIRKVSPPTPLGTSLAESSSWAKFTFVTFGAFLAPLFEELLYRGLFFRVLLKNKDKLWAIFGTSFCFWALHADRAGDNLVLGTLLIFSFCVTWVRFLTRTTLTAIIMHYAYNIGIFVFSILFLLITNISILESSFIEFFPKDRQESILLKAIERNPALSSAYNNLAWFYATEERNLDKALSLVERALELEPEEEHALDTKAEVLFKMERVDEAIAIETKLVTRFPKDAFYRKQLKTFEEKRSRRAST